MKTSFYILLVSLWFYNSLKAQISTTFFVDGVCGMCQERIEKAANVNGVKKVHWDIEKKELSVIYLPDYIDEIAIHKAVAKVGHDTKMIKATDSAYNSLHHCCLYREDEVKKAHGEEINSTVKLEGVVRGILYQKKEELFGANVYWLETTRGMITNERGEFSLERKEGENHLIISYVGLKSDTIKINYEKSVEIVLSNSAKLKEFRVIEKLSSIEILQLNVVQIEKMNEKELQKAACCNLSESFETNPSVDVAYTDAITGTKQIQMLGLSGPNIQITNGNIPDVRGLTSIQGLTFVPGSWIKNIYLNKGTGSVINGFESIAGQINVELKEIDDKLFFNLYGNRMGRTEANVSISKQINDQLGTFFHLHSGNRIFKNDFNEDDFLDNPLSNAIFLHNGWSYNRSNGFEMQYGIEGNFKDVVGGQVNFDKDQRIDTNSPWGLMTNLKRVKGWLKAGKVFKENPSKSMGLQLSASYFEELSHIGLNAYFGKQNSYYANYIYQNMIKNTDYLYKVGVSFQADEYLEEVNLDFFRRSEYVPGAFGEMTISSLKNLKIVLGMRADNHNLYGLFFTPRMHIKYDIDEKTAIRFSGGRGLRTANIFSENMQMFATSRNIIVSSDSTSSLPYGLNAEIAWNTGINITKRFTFFEREGVIRSDFYYTNFENQIVIDWENPREVSIYNLQGKSISNSFQIQLDYEIFNQFDVRLAYRFYDVNLTYGGENILSKPLLSRNRAFLNIGYEPIEHLLIDFTINWMGQKRLPSTTSNPFEFQLEENSPEFYLLNMQITKKWKKLSVYLGGENLLNFKQKKPILGAENPFGTYFDSSIVWGPIFGRNIYFGLRYSI